MFDRDRVTSATVYADWANGSDAWDGTSPIHSGGTVGPLKTIQTALDYASKNFDLAPPFAWAPELGAVGYRPGVVVQLAPAPATNPYLLPNPAFLDGFGASGPIYLRGDPANPLSTFIYANNSLQGLTAQNGGALMIEGVAIQGDANCTLVNTLEGGKIGIKNIWLGTGNTGLCCAIGAAGASSLDVNGTVNFWSSGFISVFESIEQSRISFNCNPITGAAPVMNLANAMNFGTLMVGSHADIVFVGPNPPTWTGHWTDAASSGNRLGLYRGTYMGVSAASLPASATIGAGAVDATSVYQP